MDTLELDEYNEFVCRYGPPTLPASPMWEFKKLRRRAKARGVSWHLEFVDWWHIWLESGQWGVRESLPFENLRGIGCCMVRKDPTRGFSVDNVRIGAKPWTNKTSHI